MPRRQAKPAINARLWQAAVYLVLISLLGGAAAQWSFSYIFLTLTVIVGATLLAWQGGYAVLASLPVTARIALVGIAALPLLQIVPLPPALWQALPGQALRLETLTLLGLADHWQPISLEPVSTALSAVLAVGFVTLVLMLVRLDQAGFRRILQVMFGLVLLNIAIGIVQVMSGGQVLRIHPVNNGGTLLGIFANKNHVGLLLAASIPLVGLVLGRQIRDHHRQRLTVLGYLAFALICIVTTNSRAGLVLGGLASIPVLLEQMRRTSTILKVALVVAFLLVLILVVSTGAFEIVSSRVEDADQDLRWTFVQWTLPLAGQYVLFGSGAGSFATLFATGEQLAWVKPTFVNQVHNDYLQLVIEFGVAGVALLLSLILSVLASIRAARRLPRGSEVRREVTFGVMVLLLFAIHSVIDYPLRRPAAWAMFAIGVAAVYRGSAQRVKLLADATATREMAA